MAKAKTRGARPKGSVEQIKARAGDALALVNEYRTLLEARLPANFTASFTTDVGAIGGVVPGALVARTEKRAATGNERALAKDTADHVGSIRENVKHAYPNDKAVLKGWGVGTKVNASVTKQVIAAGSLVLARAAAHPDEVSAAGILDSDLSSLGAQVSALQGADDDQGTKIRGSKDATAARDATLVRLESAVKTVGLRGVQEFRQQAAVRARFEKLLAPYGGKATKPAAKTPAASASA